MIILSILSCNGMIFRGGAAMNKYHDIGEIKFHGDFLEATIDGATRRVQLKDISPLLEKASEIERNTFEVSPSGYGIH